MTDKKRNGRGRPVEYPMPERIPDTPENIVRTILTTRPKKPHEWRYLKQARRQR